jgi:hypothetical protein
VPHEPFAGVAQIFSIHEIALIFQRF